jgi:mevalonate kinase
MPAFTATAPGKIILFGEHAVVYGEPAIAAPFPSLQARAVISPLIDAEPGLILLEAPQIDLSAELSELDAGQPLKAAISGVQEALGVSRSPACQISVTSSIPSGSGLGSGAAVSTAIIRAYAAFLGKRLSDEEVSRLAFEVEKIHHGTPSGIDNTVIAHQKAVYYQKGERFHFLEVPTSFSILVINSGSPGNTFNAVQQVRRSWENEPERYNRIFTAVGEISRQAREMIETGIPLGLGPLMDSNHSLLQELGVSTPEIDRLAEVARRAGALGCKLSGGGLGGHLIALVENGGEGITREVIKAGAASALMMQIPSTLPG